MRSLLLTGFCRQSFFFIYSIAIVWKPSSFLISRTATSRAGAGAGAGARTCSQVSGVAAAFSSTVPPSSMQITRRSLIRTKIHNNAEINWLTSSTRSYSRSAATLLSASSQSKSTSGSATGGTKKSKNKEGDGEFTPSSLDDDDSTTSKKVLNLSTVHKQELETILVDGWGYPRYRADQVWNWIRVRGVTDVSQMNNLPAKLRQQLGEFSKPSSLEVVVEQVSQKDGTIKRAYRCADGQVIESVLMGPYDDGRYTACISSQAGCAQGCVFCATGQMGFRRQLTADEILEQVSRYAAELQNQKGGDSKQKKQPRLSNIVFMGMGEPLANYKHVRTAINRIIDELGIGARRITVSTVGIVPRIRQMWQDPEMPSGVKLAVSLHCASDEERDALLPANRRYGGLDELLASLQEYQEGTNRRITLEWALIEGTNDSVETARKLGNLLVRRGQLRRDLLHINVIPLNPTAYKGRPSSRGRVNKFCQVLQDEFRIACTPRVRRGIDIDAGCGQLTTQIEKKGEHEEQEEKDLEVASFLSSAQQRAPPQVGVYDDDYESDDDEDDTCTEELSFSIDSDAVDFERADDYEDPQFSSDLEQEEAARLIALVKGTTVPVVEDNHTRSNNQEPKRPLRVDLKTKTNKRTIKSQQK